MKFPAYIMIRVRRPDEYEDVAAQLVAEDFLATHDNGNWHYDVTDGESALRAWMER